MDVVEAVMTALGVIELLRLLVQPLLHLGHGVGILSAVRV